MSNRFVSTDFNDLGILDDFVDAGVADVAAINTDLGVLVTDDARVMVDRGDIEAQQAGITLLKNQALVRVFKTEEVTAPLRTDYTITIGAEVFTVKGRSAGNDEGSWVYICQM